MPRSATTTIVDTQYEDLVRHVRDNGTIKTDRTGTGRRMSTEPVGLLGQPDLRLGLIWAQAHDRAIGANGDLAWDVPEDLRHFRATTRGYAVIHGRVSYEALPTPFRPLPGRRNIVLTRQSNYQAPGAEVATSLDDALKLLDGKPAWVCGGGQVYAEAIHKADVLVVTDIDLRIAGDTHAPVIGPEWEPAQKAEWQTSSTGVPYRITTYLRRP